MALLKILVADDSRVSRRFVVDGLEKTMRVGEIDEVEDGPEAVAKIAENDYDMVFCDVQMPTMTGMEVIAAVKEARKNSERHMPFVVFMSASVTPEMYIEAEALGAVEFLMKPFNSGDMNNLITLCMRMRTDMRVLVVDDSTTIRRVIERICKGSAFSIVFDEAESGKEAMDKIAKGTYDAVFLDVNMPNMNGMQALSMMRTAQPKLKVLLMSSEPRDTIKGRAGALKIDAFLHKPFRSADVDLALCYLYGVKAPRLGANAAAAV